MSITPGTVGSKRGRDLISPAVRPGGVKRTRLLSPIPEDRPEDAEVYAERPGSALPTCTGRYEMPSWVSIPPQPDAELLADSVRMENDPGYKVEILPSVEVDQAQILAEHGAGREPSVAFRLFRERLTWQMIKRCWFAALTDFNVQELFQKWNPRCFVVFIQIFKECIDLEFLNHGSQEDPKSLAALFKSGSVQVIFKGGNAVTLIKGAARAMLPLEVREKLRCLSPSGLSDLDFLGLINYVDVPWLAEPAEYARIHAAVRCASIRGLSRVIERIEKGVAEGDRAFANFTALFREIDRTLLSRRLVEVLNKSTQSLKEEVEAVLVDTGVAPAGIESSLQMLETFSLPNGGEVLPGPRESIAIHQKNVRHGRVEVTYHGEPTHLYLSDNPDISFKDLRCVDKPDSCSFSLVRALIGFNVSASVEVSPELHDEVSYDYHRFTKGEGIDIAIPKLTDIAHKISLVQWAKDPCMRSKPATMRAGDTCVRLPMESLDSLIFEQRDLSFGRRMQSVLIWRIAKVTKRLGRLLELCGIKALTLKFAWQRKAAAFEYLTARLDRFGKQTLPKLYDGIVEHDGERTPPRQRRRMSEIGRVERVEIRDVVRPWTDTKRSTDHDIDEVLDAARVNEVVLQCLDDLALKIFSDVKRKDLPKNFVVRWQEIIAPMVELSKAFTETYRTLGRLHKEGQAPSFYSDEKLYSFNFGDSWEQFTT